MATHGWMPRPWDAELSGCVWLPRLLDKGRRALEGQRAKADLMNGFLFGDNDYADGKLLKFLNTNDVHVRDVLARYEDDAAAAEVLMRESGRTEAEARAWSRRFRKMNAPFIAMWEADEGRRPESIGTTLLDVIYNFGLMPPVYLLFRISEKLRGDVSASHGPTERPASAG